MIIKLEDFTIRIVNKSTNETLECRQVVSVTINQSTFDSHIGYTITAIDDLPKYTAENINLNRPNYEISLIYQDKIQPATFKHVAALAGKYMFLFD